MHVCAYVRVVYNLCLVDKNNKSKTLRVSKRKKEGSGEPVVEMLLQRKELRDKMLYKVAANGYVTCICGARD